ncbi:hypothetical protein TIFTF001_020779 [Ficus carica]|uniref:Uncharacterized protein n=1 Tax=Ficus carica TaxID=3494 RepID=A0AA88AFJ8_FICCA|nr:hypothetical protein TIFTF001_020779 [Ficus carica]
MNGGRAELRHRQRRSGQNSGCGVVDGPPATMEEEHT